MSLPKLSGAKGIACRLLAVALAVCSVSDGRTSRVAYAQGASDPTVVKRLAEFGAQPVSPDRATPEAYAAFFRADVAKWAPVIKAAGVYAD